jgi:hypothetical protein
LARRVDGWREITKGFCQALKGKRVCRVGALDNLRVFLLNRHFLRLWIEQAAFDSRVKPSIPPSAVKRLKNISLYSFHSISNFLSNFKATCETRNNIYNHWLCLFNFSVQNIFGLEPSVFGQNSRDREIGLKWSRYSRLLAAFGHSNWQWQGQIIHWSEP